MTKIANRIRLSDYSETESLIICLISSVIGPPHHHPNHVAWPIKGSHACMEAYPKHHNTKKPFIIIQKDGEQEHSLCISGRYDESRVAALTFLAKTLEGPNRERLQQLLQND